MTKGQALTAVVLGHLAVSIVHGTAHAGADVPLTPAENLFVYVVILAGPLAGLAIWRWRQNAGAWIVAMSMGGALVFGLINHFIISGPDHVMHVAAEERALFGATAVLLVALEAAGAVVGLWSRRSS